MQNQQLNQTIIPYFMVLNGPKFIEFTKKVFQAEVVKIDKLEGTEGIIHAEMKIGNSTIYFADTSADGSYILEEGRQGYPLSHNYPEEARTINLLKKLTKINMVNTN